LFLAVAAVVAMMPLAAAVADNMSQAQLHFYQVLPIPLLLVVGALRQPLYFPRKEALGLLRQH